MHKLFRDILPKSFTEFHVCKCVVREKPTKIINKNLFYLLLSFCFVLFFSAQTILLPQEQVVSCIWQRICDVVRKYIPNCIPLSCNDVCFQKENEIISILGIPCKIIIQLLVLIRIGPSYSSLH